MRHFDEIRDLAARQKGGDAELEKLLATSMWQAPAGETDDRWLSRLSQYVFSAGFNWKVVESKWPGHEKAFRGFNLDYCADLSLEQIGELLNNTDIIRHGAKVKSVKDNAIFLKSLSAEYGMPAGQVILDWPDEDYMGLLALLKKRGSRLGGATVQYALRTMGKPCMILSQDVIAALVREGVIDKAPTSQKAMAQVQEALNIWREQSGLSLTDISRILAYSTG